MLGWCHHDEALRLQARYGSHHHFILLIDDKGIFCEQWRARWIDEGMPWRSKGQNPPSNRDMRNGFFWPFLPILSFEQDTLRPFSPRLGNRLWIVLAVIPLGRDALAARTGLETGRLNVRRTT
jgi:hypothetical protein